MYSLFFPIVNVCRRIKGIYLRTLMFFIAYTMRKIKILPKDKKIVGLKDKYKGKRIFVIATGPSLRIEDLEWLSNNQEITIAVNGIFKMYDKTDWRPTYYALDDYFLYRKYKEEFGGLDVSKIAEEFAIFSEPIKSELTKEQCKQAGFIPICYYDHWFTHYSKHFRYNSDIVYGHFDAYTVTNFAINIADYMGASEIILLGTDCDYFQKQAHAGEMSNSGNTLDAQKMYDAQMAGYNFINSKLNDSQPKIYNATRGGKLEAFPRRSMEEIKNESERKYGKKLYIDK